MDDRPRTDHVNKHISEQFDLELDEARGKLMAMGGLVEQQLRDACHAFFTHDEPLATQVRSRDGRINKMEVELDEHCKDQSKQIDFHPPDFLSNNIADWSYQ
jgi:phosphate uptake regulator